MTNGELIKKLRQERGMSQLQLSRDISSRTTLSSFENNKSRVASDILFKYLKRMNVTVQEYTFYLNNSTQTEKEQALQYFQENIYQERDFEIQKRILNFQAKYKDYNDFFFCCLSIELKLFLNKSHEKPVFDVDEDIGLIKNYLEGIQQWGHFEMFLFSNCLQIFSSEYIRATFNTLFRKTKILSQIDTYKSDLAIFLNNCIVLSFERKDFQNARFYIQQLNSVSQDTPRKMYDKLMSNYYLELLKHLITRNSMVTSVINQFEMMGFDEHADRLSEFKDRMEYEVNGIIS
ncbi:Rgg/GadR/MutR family transcriptional regulator [Fructilactobacillus lindneri]|uniref:HTH cro/C1-type domain-containing protein n=1 Tax=Fructilactobacillus lindneri DSM 20690 = JCM 11027 TaxID=1122148 RepID=A0A0R2JM28_9LACO|nr:Rgg/GadR/MutR family transcriptional regulator [Fructilactobacillus lindneri]KRN78249.1 hypothetical protein IV52_GL001383 [Fructilactobacillus lindneri DSM 20690 = JCM 11027]POH05865.1 hypothetical protein BGL35_04960 [Fructilactobacillus lindneri]POH23589.1 hypothetical protein BHU33_04965 [Fructilactobacillus lindneri DSM 20690 = JCM 11027]SJZ95165.1 transcriptional activator, Rgg/GadR/MutR family, C-terminal domain-containing protein [Fructilactobacillus lindneri DSM 20690 = JCM 11027]